MTWIGFNAFNCTGLISVSVNIETPLTINNWIFSNRTNATLYVPYGCKDAYESADYWKEFMEIVEMAPTSIIIKMATAGGAARSMIGYSSEYGLDFTDIPELRAYIVSGYNWKKEAMLLHVKVVPPRTGIVIKTTNDVYNGEEFDVPVSTEDYYYANLLVPVVESQTIQPTETIDEVEFTNFMVGKLTGGGMGFVRLTSPVVRQNKSYLRVPTSLYNNNPAAHELGGIGIEFLDDEDVTGIRNINSDTRQYDGEYYDLQGRKVNATSKGIYISNGKKVLVK